MNPSKIRLSVVVMTHPRRLAAAELLRCRYPDLDIRIVLDPAPQAPPATMRTARLAWRAVAERATHHIVLQDDIIAGSTFSAQLRAALAARPGDAVSLFAEWGSRSASVARFAALAGMAFAGVADDYVPTVAISLPADLATGFADFCQAQPDHATDDSSLHAYLRKVGVAAYVAVPNLVEHDERRSIIGNNSMGERRSACAPAPDATYVAEAALPAPPVIPYLCWWMGAAVCFVRGEAGPDDWQRLPAPTVAARLGASPSDLAQAYRAAAPSVASTLARTGRTLLRPAILTELHTTAFMLGLLAADPSKSHALTPDAIEARLADPVTVAALDSLAPGGLRRFLDPAATAVVTDSVRPLVHTAVRQGARHRWRRAPR